MNTISVIILVKSPREIFHKTLESVKCFDEIIIVNTGSKTSLEPFLKGYPSVKVYDKKFCGFGVLKQFAEMQTLNDWVLSIDSDEVLSQKAQEKLKTLDLDPMSVYSFPFYNYLYGKWIKSCDWYPDKHVRLYNKSKAKFSSDMVHEKIVANGLKVSHLQVPINHFSYETIDDFLSKMKIYSGLYADARDKKGSFLFLRAVFSGIFTFFKSYIFQKGFISGAEGFIISLYKSQVAFYKYIKCWEKFKRL